MAFVAGHEKKGGRKKGTGNRATVAAICERLKCDPFEGMARIAIDEEQKPELRFRCYAELGQYLRPKLRAIELSGVGGGAIEVKDVSATELLTRRINSLAARIGKDRSSGGTD